MKKLLTLLLVLSLASVASAGQSLGGATEVDITGTAIVTLISDDGTGGNTNYIDDSDGAASSLGAVTGVAATAAAGGNATVTLKNGYAYLVVGADSETPNTLESGVRFNLTVSGAGHVKDDVITVTLYGPGWVNVLDTQSVTVVPEPMTIALLGLGGLFLRRRK